MNGRVVVGFAPTLAGYEALRYAVAQARGRAATLVVVHAVHLDPHDSWVQNRLPVMVAVTTQVTTAFHEALGGVPADLDVQVLVEVGPVDLVLRAAADRPDDLVVVGACTRRRLGALTHGATLRRTLRSAICPVVIIPPPVMARLGSTTRLGRHAIAEVERFLEQPAELTS
jgi:nucleotide-binding universal stress UspA family protein